MDFITGLKRTETQRTEKGALGYKTTGNTLLDMHGFISSYRFENEEKIGNLFLHALSEDPYYAAIWMFHVRDVRGGAKEKRLFNILFKIFSRNYPEISIRLLPLIAEYGYWKDLVNLYSQNVLKSSIIDLFRIQLNEDISNLEANRPVSLLAKWLPSSNASSSNTRKLAYSIRKRLGLNEVSYRKILRDLRKKCNIVETDMSANRWEKIDYEKVASRANILYNKAFLRHDESRRRNFLEAAKKGEKKINSKTLFPHEIVHNLFNASNKGEKDTLEVLWKALPDYIEGAENILPVIDTSGSMFSSAIPGSKFCALDVAWALGIYCSEKLSGQFKNQVMTFSTNPKLVTLPQSSLEHKLLYLRANSINESTRIDKVFKLILDVALRNCLSQEELPSKILIISDGEFDRMSSSSSSYFFSKEDLERSIEQNNILFEEVQELYLQKGYKLPELIFWNVCGRTKTISMQRNELGFKMLSGFSEAGFKMALSDKTDPLESLKEILDSDRYEAVRNTIMKEG